MSHSVDEHEVRRIAKLARLALNDDEARRFAPQLSNVLGYMKRLDSIEPITRETDHDHTENRLSEDLPGPMLSNEDLLRISPANDGPYVRVPKVIDDGSSS